jgi:hypothetical protein
MRKYLKENNQEPIFIFEMYLSRIKGVSLKLLFDCERLRDLLNKIFKVYILQYAALLSCRLSLISGPQEASDIEKN